MSQLFTKSSERKRFNISRLAIKYARIAVFIWIAITVAGLLAFSSLKYALFPDITFPVVVISAQSPTPSTVLETETTLTKPIETPLTSLDGFRDVSSTTFTGRSIVSIFFEIGTNLETATQGVKNALPQVKLPPDSTYEVFPVNLNETGVISYALINDTQDLDQLNQIAHDQIIPALSSVPGVLKVNLLGDIPTDTPDQNTSSLARQYPTRVLFKGQEGLALQVVKKSDANTLNVVDEVEKTVANLKIKDAQLILAESQAQYIREATQATISALEEGVILAVIVIFPFLRSIRATFITALAIPISLLGTTIVMAILGYNLETITLLALALVIGIVVDDGIVDVENIARHIDQGENPKQAAIQGTDEIGLAVTASTLTIVSVFIPVAFMGGAVGKFFQPFGLTISAAVLFSLLVARTLSPVLAIYWLKPRQRKEGETDYLHSHLINGYRNLLRWSLHHRPIIIAIALISLMAGIALIPLIPKGFIPQLDRGEFNIVYTAAIPKKLLKIEANEPKVTPKSSSSGSFDWIDTLAKSPEKFLLRRTIKVAKDFQESLAKIPEIESTFTITGIRGEPTKGRIYVKLKSDRTLTTAQVQEKVRTTLPQIKGVTLSVEDIPFVQTEAEKPLQIAIKGDDLDDLKKYSQELKTKITEIQGLKDITSSNSDTPGEITQIERLNGQRVIYLSANLAEGKGLEDAVIHIEEIAQSILPQNITLARWGSAAQSGDVLRSFAQTLTLAIALMLGVLILLFGRVLEPIVIILSLPLSIVGAMLGLLITQSAFGVISLIGLIFLVGLLAKNSILLLDYINQLRQTGSSREEAIIETGAVRIRPIIMTTASTILGMSPIALGWGAGAELRQPMAVAIMGGLTTSSLLSLIVVPVLYTLLEDGWKKITQKKTS